MEELNNVFDNKLNIEGNLIIRKELSEHKKQEQTNKIFSEKWSKAQKNMVIEAGLDFQKNWFMKLYGFKDETDLENFLQSQKIILDAGCGLGYKAAWFAGLAPQSLVIGMDFSDSVKLAAQKYDYQNLFFVKGDISATGIINNSIDYISCDQVIHHTEDPDSTFRHLVDIISNNGQLGCNVYAKKAMPRELLDDHFRKLTIELNSEEIWELSEQLTELGKLLSELNISFECPDIPLLNIKGGKYDIQRFIYWNFMKCFWNEELGYEYSLSCNFDWYAPANARRYNEDEFMHLIKSCNLEILYFNKEEACYSGRFRKSG